MVINGTAMGAVAFKGEGSDRELAPNDRGPERCLEIRLSRNIKGAHFAVGFDRSHHHLPKGAPL
jgi:hypothetical protein